MFDQKDVEAYRRIKAPEELREQVMRLEQKPEPTRTRTKWISFGSLAAAACAAVLFIAALPPFAVRGETALLYQGVPIGAEPVSIPADHPQRHLDFAKSPAEFLWRWKRRNDPGICFRR